MTAMEKEETLVIDLDELEKTGALPEERLFYADTFNDFKEQIIRKTSTNVSHIRNKDVVTYVHKPCYFVNGGRGSGKSTILFALQDALCNKNHDVKMRLLASIDPTELSDAESFFIHLLGHVQKCLNESTKGDCYRNDYKFERKKVYDTLHKMSRGLALIAKKTENIEHLSDAEFFVQDSIVECISGAHLKAKFAELVDSLCKLLGVDALLVTVDDGDMNFNKCSEVFETVRKYLLTPRMVYVFAGDQKLYTMVVRGMQMRHFGKYSLDYDEERKSQIIHLLDNLEEQYIIKLFPAENRIVLSDFGGILSKNPQIKHHGKPKFQAIGIKEFIKQLEELKVVDDGEAITRFLSLLSVRSALQLLAYWVRHMNLCAEAQKNNMLFFCDGVQHVVSHALIKYGVEVNAVRRNAPYGLLRFILLHIQHLKQGLCGLCMRPGMGDDLLQMVSFYLSAEFYRLVNRRSDIIACILNIFPYYNKYGEYEGHSDVLVNHLSVTSVQRIGAECTDIMLHMNNRKDRETRPFAYGVMPVFSQAYKNCNLGIERVSFDDFMLQLMETVLNEPILDNIMYFLAVYHLLSRSRIDELSVSCLSIYNILATIQRLMACAPDATDTMVEDILFEFKEITVDIRDAEKFRKLAPKLSAMEELQSYDNKEILVYRFVLHLRSLSACKGVVKEIIKNLSYTEELRYSTQSLYMCWECFMRKCGEVTESARIRAVKCDDLVRADTLIEKYLIAFDNALYDSLVIENNLEALPLIDFPLYKSIVTPPEKLAALMSAVNISTAGNPDAD